MSVCVNKMFSFLLSLKTAQSFTRTHTTISIWLYPKWAIYGCLFAYMCLFVCECEHSRWTHCIRIPFHSNAFNICKVPFWQKTIGGKVTMQLFAVTEMYPLHKQQTHGGSRGMEITSPINNKLLIVGERDNREFLLTFESFLSRRVGVQVNGRRMLTLTITDKKRIQRRIA